MNKNSTLIMSFSLDSTLAPKFEARVYSSLQVESLGLAINLGARVVLTSPDFTLATTYTYVMAVLKPCSFKDQRK